MGLFPPYHTPIPRFPFLFPSYPAHYLVLSLSHLVDVVGLRVYDLRDTELPSIGLIKLLDAESGQDIWVDTSSNYIRDTYRHSWRKRTEDLNEMLSKNGVDYTQISTDEDYVKPLMNLFKRRAG